MNRSSIKILCSLTISIFAAYNNQITASTPLASVQVVNRSSRNALPADLLTQAQEAKISILKPKDIDLPILYQNYPDGSLLFANNPDIATKFNVMIAQIKKNPNLIEFFRKIHILSLNHLYNYIMKIYTNLNLTNPGCSQDTENPTADVQAYLTNEATYATNKKKLLVNHFLNIIQAQFGASIVSYVTTTPPDMAVALGKLFVHNDCGINLKDFTVPQTDPAVIANQELCIAFLQKYIDFFQSFTNYLSKVNPMGINQYYTIAQSINGLTNSSTKMNPAMFFYDTESMRSIQFIPFVAGTIPTNSQLIPWAPSIVNAAVKNLTSNGSPIAYFKDAAGKKTQNQSDAHSLHLVVATGSVLFEEELRAQPAWMNTQDGSIRILQACLGNFAALVGLGILDSTLEKIIQKALNLKAVSSTSSTQKTEISTNSKMKK